MPFITKYEFNKIVKFAEAFYETDNIAESQAYLKLYTNAYVKARGSAAGVNPAAKKVFYEAKATAGLDDKIAFNTAFIKGLSEDLTIGDPVFIVIDKLNEHIKKLKSEWNTFSGWEGVELKEKKINALQSLVHNLLTGKPQFVTSMNDEPPNQRTIGEMLNDWGFGLNKIGPSPYSIISKHSSIFNNQKDESMPVRYDEIAPTNTDTLNLIAELHLKYGSKSMATKVDRSEKQRMFQPFVEYLNSRMSWFEKIITFFFRNSTLSAKKLELAEKVVDEIRESDDSYENLMYLLQGEKAKHLNLSREHGKNHINLESKVTTKDRQFGLFKEGPNQVEDSCSELADAFHASIGM
jgi:hypothetical protein